MKYVIKIYHTLRKNYVLFTFFIRLKEVGIFSTIHTFLAKYLYAARRNGSYFRKNEEFVNARGEAETQILLTLLADEKSRQVWTGAMDYRVYGTFLKKNICDMKWEYFPEDITHLSEGEVFIDCGAYIGDTVQSFIDYTKKKNIKYKKIVAFEPTKDHFNQLNSFFGKRKDIICINKGISSKREIISFNIVENGASRIVEGSCGNGHLEVIDLDSVKECRDATFIKMDIEGAEMEALKGAKNLIKKNKPKLAICIYHSNEDMHRIIRYVHELVPEYKLYVRNHSGEALDTVLYALV